MKKTKCCIGLVVILLLFCNSSIAGYAAESRTGLYYRWDDPSETVSFYCGFNYVWTDEIEAAMEIWNVVKDENTDEDIVPLELTTSDYDCENCFYAVSSGNFIAIAIPDYEISGILNSVDIAFNNGVYSFTRGASTGKYDIQSVTVHELGHAIGIAHCHEIESGMLCLSSTCPSNVMSPQMEDNFIRRTLTDDDISSKRERY